MTRGLRRAPLGNGTLPAMLHCPRLLALCIAGLGQVAWGQPPRQPPVPIPAPPEPIPGAATAGASPAEPVVSRPERDGRLYVEVIRRGIRSHIMEVKDCYESGLRRNRSLQGRVVVEFVISLSGQVSRSGLVNSTLGDATTESCVVAVVGRWMFPSPRNGLPVKVSYPFVLTTASGTSAALTPPEPLADADFAVGSSDGPVVPPSERHGSLDKEVIRRVIRRNINAVRYCYEGGLRRDPLLAGRIMVQFVISPSGPVSSSALENSTMGDAAVESCVVAAVGRWVFPSPRGGGSITVSYPFVLTPLPGRSSGSATAPPIQKVSGSPSTSSPRLESRIGLRVGRTGTGMVFLQPLNESVFVHDSIDGHYTSANGLVAVTTAGLLLVDTAWTDEQTEAILAWAESYLGRRFVRVLITHDRPERDGGLQAVVRRHLPVAALDLTAAKLVARGFGDVKTLFTTRQESMTDPSGFEVFYPGPGPSSDSIAVAFPAVGVLFAGPLLAARQATSLGFTGKADPRAWSAAVRRVSARYPRVLVVPGQGTFSSDGQVLYAHTLELLATEPPSSLPAAGSDAGSVSQ